MCDVLKAAFFYFKAVNSSIFLTGMGCDVIFHFKCIASKVCSGILIISTCTPKESTSLVHLYLFCMRKIGKQLGDIIVGTEQVLCFTKEEKGSLPHYMDGYIIRDLS